MLEDLEWWGYGETRVQLRQNCVVRRTALDSEAEKGAMDSFKELLGSEARARVLAHFAVHSDSDLHMRALERHTGLPSRSLQIELERLARMGLLRRERRGPHVVYMRAEVGPVWTAIEELVRRFALLQLLRDSLGNVPGVVAAFVFGSFASGTARPDSDIDVFVFGDDIADADLGAALNDLHLILDRPLDVKRYDTASFVRDAREGASFLLTALCGPLQWIVGSPASLPPAHGGVAA